MLANLVADIYGNGVFKKTVCFQSLFGQRIYGHIFIKSAGKTLNIAYSHKIVKRYLEIGKIYIAPIKSKAGKL